jgi:ComEC/Rec2-related protein
MLLRRTWLAAGWAFLLTAGWAWPRPEHAAAYRPALLACGAGAALVALGLLRFRSQRPGGALTLAFLLPVAAALLALARTPPAPSGEFTEPRPIRFDAIVTAWREQAATRSGGDASSGWGQLGQLSWEGDSRSGRPPPQRIWVTGSWQGIGTLRPGRAVQVEGLASTVDGRLRVDRAILRPRDGGGRWMPFAVLRQRVHERLHRQLSPLEAGLASALLLGSWSEVSDAQAEAYRRFGLLHILAVSGFHLWLWDLLLRRLLPASCQRARLPILVSVTGLAGFAPAVLRALIAILLRDQLQRRGRAVDAWRLWTAGIFLEAAFFAPERQGLGFVLSYAATGFLIAAPTWPRAPQPLRATIASLAAFLGSLPWLAQAQGSCEPWSIPFSPIFALLLPLRILLAVGALLPGLGDVSDVLLTQITRVEMTAFSWISTLPGAPLPVTQLWPGALFLCSFAGLAALRAAGSNRSALALAAGITALLSLVPRSPHEPGLLALPVGHGLGIVIAGAEHSLIFDLGSREREPNAIVDRILFPELLRRAWPAPSAAVLSHRDEDHAAGLELLHARHSLLRIIPAAGEEWLTEDFHPFSLRILGCRAAVTGVSNAAGPIIEARRMGPDGQPWRAVLCGDQFGYALRELRTRLAPGPIDILLLPHHGLTTDGLADLLDYLQPREAWASCSFKHLPLPVAELCARRGIRLRTTVGGALAWP